MLVGIGVYALWLIVVAGVAAPKPRPARSR
jgi:hypothetical protein